MASNYSDRLKLELMETGANANVWGNNTNTNLETIDAFGAGYLSKSVAGSANVTLTTNNADPTAEASNKVVEFTGELTGNIHVFIPAVESNYIFFNNTSGSFTLDVAPTGHGANSVEITQGAHTIIYSTGTKCVDLFANSLGTVSVKGTANIAGNVTVASNGLVTASSFTGDGSGLSNVVTLDAGTQMVFLQASAPTGWTQNTTSTLANSTLRVITSGTAGTGGSDAFASVFGGSKSTSGSASADISPLSVDTSGLSVGATTISTPTLPSHSHNFKAGPTEGRNLFAFNPTYGSYGLNPTNTNATGGGGSHSHPVSGSASVSGNIGAPAVSLSVPGMNIKHANVIVASKDA